MDKQVRKRALSQRPSIPSKRERAGESAEGSKGETAGRKYDSDKLRYDLVDTEADQEVVAVLSFGATKYDPGNWKHVEDPMNRYYAAMRRHVEAFRRGDDLDPEHGMHHLASAICCLHFMLALDLENSPGYRNDFKDRFAASMETARKLRGNRALPTK